MEMSALILSVFQFFFNNSEKLPNSQLVGRLWQNLARPCAGIGNSVLRNVWLKRKNLHGHLQYSAYRTLSLQMIILCG